MEGEIDAEVEKNKSEMWQHVRHHFSEDGKPLQSESIGSFTYVPLWKLLI